MASSVLSHFINGEWVQPSKDTQDVVNPATGVVLAQVPLGAAAEVDSAVEAAAAALKSWAETPVTDRIQHLFRLKMMLEDEFDALAAIITEECGKTLAESKGELRRGIENVEVACGAPILMQGHSNEDIARGIDGIMFASRWVCVPLSRPSTFRP